MSMTSALANALSGLTAVSRSAEVVSANISNALTEGYGRRELNLSAQTLGGQGAGVAVDGISRLVDQSIISDRRLADAASGEAGTLAEFFRKLEEVTGLPGEAGSLSDRLAVMEAALVEAASRPDSEPRLQAVVSAAQDVTTHLNTVADEIQSLRQAADSAIGAQVNRLNEALQAVEEINTQIVQLSGQGRDTSALLDHRQRLVDEIATIVPVREIPRDNGKIALVSTGGAILLDSKAAEIGFTATPTISPDMTLGSGALSGLTINGQSVTLTGGGTIAGGTLAAQFALRDDLTVEANAKLDAVARDLVERFQSPTLDATLGASDPGLFTDNGGFFLAADEEGLAHRISVNSLVDPNDGGALWRLRDGLGAATQGDVGNASLLQALGDALSDTRVPASGNYSGAARSASGLVSDFLSYAGSARQSAETEVAYQSVRQEVLKEQELQSGVDTDHEMQQLLLIEQAYAANARVMQTVDELIQTLLGI